PHGRGRRRRRRHRSDGDRSPALGPKGRRLTRRVRRTGRPRWDPADPGSGVRRLHRARDARFVRGRRRVVRTVRAGERRRGPRSVGRRVSWFETAVAVVFGAFGARSAAHWFRRPFAGTDATDHLLFALFVLGRVGLWWSLAGLFAI